MDMIFCICILVFQFKKYIQVYYYIQYSIFYNISKPQHQQQFKIYLTQLLAYKMNQLQMKMKKRQQASGIVDQPVAKTTQIKVEPKKVVNAQFQANRNKIKALFEKQGGGGTSTSAQKTVTIPKQQIKGNAEGFSNAKKLLQQNLGKGGSSKPAPVSSIGLPPPPPPPPSLGSLPPPPPPPPLGNLPLLPPPPPPPPLPTNLSSNQGIPPPPPRLSTVIGTSQQQPASKNQYNQTKQQKTNNLPPPPPPPPPPTNFSSSNSFNLPPPPPPPQTQPKTQNNQPKYANNSYNLPPPSPPPPPQTQPRTQHKQPKQTSNAYNLPPPPPPPLPQIQLKNQYKPPKQMNNAYNLPPPPPPPPSNSSVQMNQPSMISKNKNEPNYTPAYLSPPSQQQSYIQKQKKTSNLQQPYTNNSYINNPPQQQHVYNQQPPVSNQQQHVYNQQPQQIPNQNYKQAMSNSPQQIQNIPNQQLNQNRSPIKSNEVNHQAKSRQKKGQRQQIFKGTKQNLSAQFFQNDVAGFIKRQFIRQANVMSLVGLKIKKQVYKFNFPTIENKVREIQPIQTLYADAGSLDLVSCYMQKNVNSTKAHIDARQAFFNSIKSYNWNIDEKKLKPIKDMAANIPKSIKYKQPNFVQIKNAVDRCQTLKNYYAKHQNFNAAAEVKKLKDETQKLIYTYMKNPEDNQLALGELEKRILQIKEFKT